MLTHPTLDQLKALKLDGMADGFVELQAQDSSDELGHAEWLALLIDREAVNRNTKRFQTRMRTAKLRHIGAAIEDVDYRASRKLDKALFQQLATGRWIAEHRSRHHARSQAQAMQRCQRRLKTDRVAPYGREV